ncbi:MAG: mcpB [Herbinix sp.]|nr:mcpB [Herbinix sp.]
MKKKYISITQKIIVMLLIIVILPTALLGFTNYLSSSQLLEKSIRNAALNAVDNMTEHINTFMRLQEESLTVLSQNSDIRNIKNKTTDVYEEAFTNYLEGHSDITNVYIGLDNKKMVLYPEQELPSDYDPTTRLWYQNAINSGKLVWSNPYADANTNEMIVSVSMPIYDERNIFSGVLAIDISLGKMTEFISSTGIGEEGYMALYDSIGTAIAHPNETLVAKPVPNEELSKALYATIDGNKDYTLEKEKYCAYFTTIESTGWKLLGTFRYDEIQSKTTSILVNALIMGVITLIIALGIGYFISSPIIKNIKSLVGSMKLVGAGDLTIRSDIKAKDELGILANTFNKMVEDQQKSVNEQTRLMQTNNQIFTEVSHVAIQVEAAANQIAAGSQSLAQATTEQASVMEQINASIEEITSQSKGNADNSRRANTLVSSANDSAMQGAAKMEEMTVAMNDINEASNNISKIIKVIDDIAFQTNILALNAAVEAARAGVHGKGFAVVAEEVRNLAGRSSEAAKETTELIEGTIRKTTRGTMIAQETDESLTMIAEKISQVAKTIESISDMTTQQASAISQVKEGINQVVGTTQTNSATAQESAAASLELSSQAALLKSSVSRFELEDDAKKDLLHMSTGQSLQEEYKRISSITL